MKKQVDASSYTISRDTTWMTFKQAKEMDAHVRKGERGNLVVYANSITKTEEQDDGSEETRKIPFMKGYTVFNVEQIDGLPEHYYSKPEPVIDPALRIDHAEEFFGSTGADIRHGGHRAYYSGGSDHVQMPHFETFISPESYYATLAHELTHNADVRIMPRRSAQPVALWEDRRGVSA